MYVCNDDGPVVGRYRKLNRRLHQYPEGINDRRRVYPVIRRTLSEREKTARSSLYRFLGQKSRFTVTGEGFILHKSHLRVSKNNHHTKEKPYNIQNFCPRVCHERCYRRMSRIFRRPDLSTPLTLRFSGSLIYFMTTPD